jgi:hypothetical protein
MHNYTTSKHTLNPTTIADGLLFFHLVCWSFKVFLQPHGLPGCPHELIIFVKSAFLGAREMGELFHRWFQLSY